MFSKRSIPRIYSILLSGAFMLALVGPEYTASALPVETARTPDESAMLRFTSGGYAPGFASTSGMYDPHHALTIDPKLTWNTFLGGTDFDYGRDIAVDGSGNVYVIGDSDSTWGAPLNALAGENDAYVAKLNSSGVLQWHTFLGGSDTDFGQGIAVDSDGNIYVTGVSRADWGVPIQAFAGYIDAFVAKINNSGVLQWNTFLGGVAYDTGNGIALDQDGNPYVTGESNTDWGTPINPNAGGGPDAFIAKLDDSGTLQWHTFLGEEYQTEVGFGIDVAASGNIYVTGANDADDFTSPLVAKFNPSGVLQWNSDLGVDTSYHRGQGIAVDGDENIYVSGFSWASWGTPLEPFVGNIDDAFAAKLNSSGVLQWNTFLGGAEDDTGYDIALDSGGNLYVMGYSGSTWGAPLHAFAGYYDTFVANLDSDGGLQWNTFVGGDRHDQGYGITLDNGGNIYLTGESSGTWGSPVAAFDGVTDGFAAKLDLAPPAVLSSLRADPSPTNASSVHFTVTFSEPVSGVNSSDFYLTTTGVSGATITGVSGSGANYTVTVNTGSGSGTIRLDIVDNDSIVDGSLNRLGGTGTGNGNFTAGETYIIPPIVLSSLRADPNPNNTASVDFTVTFSVAVTGVDESDFVLTTTGGISGATITGVSGSGGNYTVTVDTGSGDGTIRLDVNDDDSIVDSAAIPLGGTGAGNGNFTSSEIYTIDKTPPTITTIFRFNANPTASTSVSFRVNFSEPVSDVQAGDFVLTTTLLTGASISNVNGMGSTRTVMVNTGSGDGTIRLDVIDDDSIMDAASNRLGGTGAGNGNFSAGETYTIDKPDLSAPVLRSPRTNLVSSNTLPTFWWTKVKGGATYEIEFATDVTFTTIVDTDTTSGTSYTVLTPFGDGLYYWHVRAFTASSQAGTWSAARTFIIDTTGPATPTLISPLDTASTSSPVFRWNAAPTAVSYELEYDDNPGFTSPTHISNIRTTSRRPPAMSAGTYYWQVRAKDALGNWGPWTAVPFTVIITGP
jgi:hypothetical protein